MPCLNPTDFSDYADSVRPKNSKKSFRASYSKQPGKLSFTSEEVEAFWSQVARQDYEAANTAIADTHTQRFAISIPRIKVPRNGKLLNLWSRQGEAIPHIRKRFPVCEVVNAEISTVMLKQSKDRFPDEAFVEADLQNINYPDNYFDCILSLEMLEHSPSPQKILHEMFRVLKSGGQLILTCPSALSEIHLWIADHLMNNHGEGPHRFPSIFHVKKMLKIAGFGLIKHRATVFVPKELGALHKLDGFLEKYFQWFPANELGIRQIYEAHVSQE